MSRRLNSLVSNLRGDLPAGLVVFVVALPLCLGVALASNAPLFSGVLAGVVGGVVVAFLSGSQTSVSGPAAGLTAVVAAQIAALGSFQVFLLAVVIAGLIQVALGIARAGSLAAFFPSGVIKGLLAAIGLILILKQIPHVFGHDTDPEGEMDFQQPDRQTTFSELGQILGDLHPGAAVIGLASIALLIGWSRWKVLKRSAIPPPLVVVLLGVGVSLLFRRIGGPWVIGPSHLVQVPVTGSLLGFLQILQLPDFSAWKNPAVYVSAVTLAAVASLETLLNLEAVDKLDPRRRISPPSRELMAQGVGNVIVGLIGGLPITSVIIRSSVNINAGSRTKLSSAVHGLLLFTTVVFLPNWLNMIPLSCLAAILLVTGVKLASPALVRQMWAEGRYQFIPFALTVVSIVLTDLLVGILIGMAASLSFILWSNARHPLRLVVGRRLGGSVVRIELANQVSFLNRAALVRALDEVPPGGQLLLDAHSTEYIDPDLISLFRDYEERTAPARGVKVTFLGFRDKYRLRDHTRREDNPGGGDGRELGPREVLKLFEEGHRRSIVDRGPTRDLARRAVEAADGPAPLAVILGCIDSPASAESAFDMGPGEILSVRVAGNVASREVLGNLEYGCVVAGARLILVMGHNRCGAVGAAVDLFGPAGTGPDLAGCLHLDHAIREIQQSIDPDQWERRGLQTDDERSAMVDDVARRNVGRVVGEILRRSPTLDGLVRDGRLLIVGALYDAATGDVEFLPDPGPDPADPEGGATSPEREVVAADP